MLDPEEIWQDWPRCPQCGRCRHAVCPYCKCAQDEMPLADYMPQSAPLESTRPERGGCGGGGCSCRSTEAEEPHTDSCEPDGADEAGPVLLLCPQCDEAFAPKFYRLCQSCSHDFGEGLAAPAEEIVESNGRALFVMFLLAAVAASIVGYCWYLFRH